MKTALITGSTSGLGQALSKRFAAQGWRVITHGRSPKQGALHIVADLAQPGAHPHIAHTLTEHGITLDLLLHNAALGSYGPLATQDPSHLRELLQVNVFAPIALTHTLLPLMKPHGALAFISSLASTLPAPLYTAYAASKAALDGFARNLRIERPDLQVTTHWPGALRTPMHARADVPPKTVQNAASPAWAADVIHRQILHGASGVAGAANGRARWAALRTPNGLLHTLLRDRTAPSPQPNTGRMRSAIITGFADGIGRALSAHYAAAGWRVLGVDMDPIRAEITARELSLPASDWLMADLGDEAALEGAIVWLSQRAPDLVIHNAGINAVGGFGTLALQRQLQVLRVNLLAPLLMTRAALQHTPNAAHVFIGSLSSFVSYPGAAVYAASKDGIAHFAHGLNAAGTAALVVHPGPTRTAHATRYSPNNLREASRMLPAVLAAQIFAAQQRQARILIPGAANRAFALTGIWLPSLTEKVMKRIILDRVKNPLL